MTLHLVYEKPGAPSTRIRLEQMAPHLEERGWPCRLAAWPRGAAARRRFAAALAAGDVVLVHRARPGRREARWWRALPVARIYDFDDAVMWGRRRGWRGLLERPRRRAGFARALACADAATCGNAWLAAWCGDLPRAVIPSAVRLDVPGHVVRDPARPLRVGWVGRASNLRYLETIAEALAAASRQVSIEVVCLSERAATLPGCRVRHVPWTREGEATTVATFDVGVMPLPPDDPWSEGKCAYKLLQYMAAGVPALGSAVGMNRELIVSGRNGLLAGCPEDWTHLLVGLARDPALRTRLGRAGRATAGSFGYAAVADRLAAFVGEVAAGWSASR